MKRTSHAVDDCIKHAEFWPLASGRLFVLETVPAAGRPHRTVILVPPFGEEMNCSRRAFTVLAENLARSGVRAVQFDLYGTGDSEGDFEHATWERWRDNLIEVAAVLRKRDSGALGVLGLRMGALLLCDAHAGLGDIGKMVLWQPLLSGKAFIQQLLRLLQVSVLASNDQRVSTSSLLNRIHCGETIEVAGYPLRPVLVDALANQTLSESLGRLSPRIPVYWMDVVPIAGQQLAPVTEATLRELGGVGIVPHVSTVEGSLFWATHEANIPATLIEKTIEVWTPR